jgi:DNA polymerase I-like protein with 3'-5' exonuclease and polymerase domains
MTLKDMKPPSMSSRREFNLASPKQLGDVLFDKLKIGGQTKENKQANMQQGGSPKLLS